MTARDELRTGLYFRDGIRLVYLIAADKMKLTLEDCHTLDQELMPIKEACERLTLVRRSRVAA